MALIISSPQGTGKTTLAEPLRQLLHADSVIEEYIPGVPVPDNVIAMTNFPDHTAVELGDVLVAVGFAMKERSPLSINLIQKMISNLS
mgnify:CR=1 FL=1